MTDQTNADRIEAFITENMPEIVLSDWQRDFLRQMFIDGCTCPPIAAGTFNNPGQVRRGWDPACNVHQRQFRIESEGSRVVHLNTETATVVLPEGAMRIEWTER